MKLSVLFLICSLSMTYAAESYAQKTMISLEVRNETVGTVLEKLKKESGFDFFFNNKHVDLKRIVSVSANNNNIFKILDQIFAGTNVKYSVLEKKIILSTEIVQGIQQGQIKVTYCKRCEWRTDNRCQCHRKRPVNRYNHRYRRAVLSGYSKRCHFTDYLYRVCFSRSESFRKERT